MKVGICGVGFVGNAVMKYLANFSNEFHIFAYDKYKNKGKGEGEGEGSFSSLLSCDYCFICLPTLYNNHAKTYDMNELNTTLSLFAAEDYKGIILIKSTVLPTFCSDMSNLYPNLMIIHNPEFLSARTALEDFSNQKHIILGYTKQSHCVLAKVVDLYKILFPLAEISICSAEESALTKLACNSFYALKVQYFSELYLLCNKLNISFDLVKDMMLKNGWINPQHTLIPGHDMNISFGGACLPKDIAALNEFMKTLAIPNKVIDAAITERNEMRE